MTQESCITASNSIDQALLTGRVGVLYAATCRCKSAAGKLENSLKTPVGNLFNNPYTTTLVTC